MLDVYTKDYYEGEGSNYAGYEDAPHFKQIANKLKEVFYPIEGKVLEVGCAKGFIVKHLRDLGVDAYGCDISQYAVDNSPVKEFLKVGDMVKLPYKDKEFNWVYSFDTLEHLKPEDVDKAISELMRIGIKQYHSITTPEYSVGEDKTHYTMQPISWWKNKFPLLSNIIIKHAGQE